MANNGKAALITGSAKRVGRAVALELAKTGFDIAVHFKSSADDAKKVAREIEKLGRRAALVSCELADLGMINNIVSDTVEAFGRIDVLVNNASIFAKTPIDQIDLAQWDRIIRVNMVAPMILARKAAPHMQKIGGGTIINLTDSNAETPIRNYDLYCATKNALAGITKSLALELAPDITVNAVAPGIALFPEHYDDQLRAKLISKVPLKREGSAREVAGLIRFLATEGKYITGQVINIDGGRSIEK